MVSMKELLCDAKERNYALGAFNITSITYADAILEAAGKCESPVILAISERHIKSGYIHLRSAAKYIEERAKEYSVPVVLHLDHGESISTIEMAINACFTSVMIDRSGESLKKNIEYTSRVVALCKNRGISVEGELGTIGGKEGEGHINVADESLFTDPQVAYQYVEQTGIDALAIAIGNVHGRYKGAPKLDFERLIKIKDLVSVPLVLHGGSGISDEDFKKLISNGIHKINFYSGNVQSSYASLSNFFDTNPLEKGKDIGELFRAIHKAVVETTMKQMNIFNSSGKA